LVIDPQLIVEALQKDQILETTVDRSDGSGLLRKRKTICDVCQDQVPKYTCPACAISTCSLPCVKKHKIELGCTGKRMPEFVSLPEMNDNHLRHDFFFIKEGERLAGESFRISSKQSKKTKRAQMIAKGNREEKDKDDIESRSWSSHTALPMALKKLVAEANSRGITLRLMPRGMTRRRVNTTFYAYKTQKFYWRIEWIFNTHLGKEKEIKLMDERVDDGTLLSEALSNRIGAITVTTNQGESDLDTSQRKALRTKLDTYLEVDSSELIILLPILYTPASQQQYHQLDQQLTVQHNLKGKTLIEFPTLYVVTKEQLPHFTIIPFEQDSQPTTETSTPQPNLDQQTESPANQSNPTDSNIVQTNISPE